MHCFRYKSCIHPILHGHRQALTFQHSIVCVLYTCFMILSLKSILTTGYLARIRQVLLLAQKAGNCGCMYLTREAEH
jgi:hypothetical protein